MELQWCPYEKPSDYLRFCVRWPINDTLPVRLEGGKACDSLRVKGRILSTRGRKLRFYGALRKI